MTAEYLAGSMAVLSAELMAAGKAGCLVCQTAAQKAGVRAGWKVASTAQH
jgi:hypothetical protein